MKFGKQKKKVKLMFSGFRRIALGLASMKILIFLVVWFHKPVVPSSYVSWPDGKSPPNTARFESH